MSNYLKSKLNNCSLKNIYLAILLPIVLYSVYKNGYIPYNKDLCSIFTMFKPLILFIISIILGYIFDYIYYKLFINDPNYKLRLNSSYTTYYSALFSLILPVNINYLLFIFFLLIYLLAISSFRNTKLNILAVIRLVLVLSLIFLHVYSYNNLYENSIVTNYTTLDVFLGHSISSIGSASTFIIILTYLFLLVVPTYKKNIPLEIILSYFIMILISSFFGFSIKEEIKLMLINEIFFASVFVATLPNYSPYTLRKELLYSILIGVLGFVFCKLYLHEGIYISILISNLIFIIIEKLSNKK